MLEAKLASKYYDITAQFSKSNTKIDITRILDLGHEDEELQEYCNHFVKNNDVLEEDAVYEKRTMIIHKTLI